MHIQSNLVEKIKNAIPIYQDWPKPGVAYKSTVGLASDPEAFSQAINWFGSILNQVSAKEIYAADARGFIFGSATAVKTLTPMHVVRKPGKLPGSVWRQEYDLEYGTDALELSQSVHVYDRQVIIIDDVLATGGTAEAICKLLHNNLGIRYSSMTVAVLINLQFLGGHTRLTDQGINVQGLINE